MLRRRPTTNDGQVVDRLQESTRVNKPFKPPTLVSSVDRVQPQRKRKRVSYKGQDPGDSDDDSDSGRKKKKQKNGSRDQAYQDENTLAAIANLNKYPVYKPKPFDEVFGNRR